MHLHASAMTAFLTFAMVIIVGALWRLVSMRLADTTAGKAMAFVY